MSDAPVKVGLIGCGNISEIYLKNDARFDPYKIVACADLMPERAQQRADAFGLTAMTVEDLLADPAIDVVLNLTVPMAHAAVDEQAMATGKSVYSEKPLAVDLADGQRLVEMAAAQGVRLACAPDTFLGAGLQTLRFLPVRLSRTTRQRGFGFFLRLASFTGRLHRHRRRWPRLALRGAV